MVSVPIPFTSAALDVHPPAGPWPSGVGFGLAVLALPVAGVLLLWLYRRELRRSTPGVATTLLALRAAVVLAVLATLLFDPVLTRTKREEVPGRVLVAIDRSDSMRVSDPHRPLPEKLRLLKVLKLAPDLYSDDELDAMATYAEKFGEPDLPRPDTHAGKKARDRLAEAVKRLDDTTRLGLTARLLGPDGANLLGGLKGKHAVAVSGFDQNAAPLPLDIGPLWKALAPDQGIPAAGSTSKPSFTDLKLPLAEASAAGSQLLGAVVFTDGRHNWGEPPGTLAEQLGRRKVPVFPVLVAPETPPPDVAVVTARPQVATVFKGSVVPVEVEVRVTGTPAGEVEVTLTGPPDADGKPRPPVTEIVVHSGKDSVYRLALKMKLDVPGPQTLTVTAKGSGPPDRFPGNDSRTARVNVVKDRARVMLIDGEARWEFHYLHTALGRDENMDVRSIVFRQPRVTTATDEDVRPLGLPARELPADPDAFSGYDCVVLGDAEPGTLKPADRERLEKYVADAGGTLVIVAGKRAMPLAYPDDDPVRKLLPIKSPRVIDDPAGFQLELTPEADRNWFLQLDDTVGSSRRVWRKFPPSYWAVVGVAKDGAEVLAGLPGQKPRDAGVVVRQNYGFGRVLYVGVDSTWRWRFKAGDLHHHRFWGQVAQWAASDRLLPTANPAGTIRFGTREPAFRVGQEVEVVARATEAVKKLGPAALKGVRVVKLPDADGKEKVASQVPLAAVDGRPREFSAAVRDLEPGRYAVELDVPEWADQLRGPPGPDGRATPLRSPFEVLPPDGEELVELSADRPLLEQIAASTGGKVYTPETAKELIDALAARAAVREDVVTRPARRSWWLLGLVSLLLTAEWGVRKWAGLP